jgi:hypothetical protein
MKHAALLLAHLSLLLDEQRDAGRARIAALHAELSRRLEGALDEHEAHVLEAGLLTPGDQRDLRILLGRGAERHSSLWLALLRYFYAAFARLRGRR